MAVVAVVAAAAVGSVLVMVDYEDEGKVIYLYCQHQRYHVLPVVWYQVVLKHTHAGHESVHVYSTRIAVRTRFRTHEYPFPRSTSSQLGSKRFLYYAIAS